MPADPPEKPEYIPTAKRRRSRLMTQFELYLAYLEARISRLEGDKENETQNHA